MIASSILTSRELAPIEQAVAQWRGFVSARKARGCLESVLDRFSEERQPMSLAAPR